MHILGIGVDVVHLPRIASLLNRRKEPSRLASRILSREEYAWWQSLPQAELELRVRFLGVRWGVKEAAYKALYPTVITTWKELTYGRLGGVTSGQKPALTYHPFKSGQADKVGMIHVSVSHDGDYVFASVLAEQPK